MTTFHRTGVSLALLSLLLTLLPLSYRTAAAADERCFPETGQCISGRFREYWEQNGALPVFGYPIGPVQNEINHETGQAYLTQWFERNRFELHGENARPYDVLLGRLGDDRLQQLGRAWQTEPREVSAKAGCRWFEQTGHSVCDQAGGIGFQSYWQSHGLQDPALDVFGRNLALFGLPLTEARAEVNPTNGKTYLTQWFERARFEWHPDESDPYKVLLGLLGNELRGMAGAQQIIANTAVGQPIAAAPYLFWIDVRGDRPALYGYNFDTQAEFLVSDVVSIRSTPASDGRVVVWVAPAADGRGMRIMCFDLTTHQTIMIRELSAPAGRESSALALSANVLYYTEDAPQHSGLFALDLTTGQEQRISSTGRNPVADGDRVLWSDVTTSGSGAGYRETWRLHLLLRSTSAERILTSQEGNQARFSGYSVAGNSVVWSFANPGTDNRVYLYDIDHGAGTPISPDAAASPALDGTRVVWATSPYFDKDPATTWSIQSYDRRSGTITTIVDHLPAQLDPRVALVRTHLVAAIDTGAALPDIGMRRSLIAIPLR